jgi:ribonucleoside-diphosphate reductase alpha chain
MLDNVYDISHFPLPQQEDVAKRSRRLGLGLTGLADALIMLGLAYGSQRARALAGEAMRVVCHAAYRASVEIAREKGPFPQFDARRYPRTGFVRGLPPDIVAAIRRDGIRNSHLVAMAPTGSISLLAGNVSSSLEPVYAHTVRRRIRLADGSDSVVSIDDHACRLFRALFGAGAGLPPAFVDAAGVTPPQQIAMQAALQRHVDNAIAKTVNVPGDCGYDAFRRVYETAYRLGLKGCAAFRPNPVTGALLVPDDAHAATHCAA